MSEVSDAARILLRLRLSGQRVEVDAESREAYRELASAGLMEPVNTLAKGRDSHFRLTLAAIQQRDGWLRGYPEQEMIDGQ